MKFKLNFIKYFVVIVILTSSSTITYANLLDNTQWHDYSTYNSWKNIEDGFSLHCCMANITASNLLDQINNLEIRPNNVNINNYLESWQYIEENGGLYHSLVNNFIVWKNACSTSPTSIINQSEQRFLNDPNLIHLGKINRLIRLRNNFMQMSFIERIFNLETQINLFESADSFIENPIIEAQAENCQEIPYYNIGLTPSCCQNIQRLNENKERYLNVLDAALNLNGDSPLFLTWYGIRELPRNNLGRFENLASYVLDIYYSLNATDHSCYQLPYLQENHIEGSDLFFDSYVEIRPYSTPIEVHQDADFSPGEVFIEGLPHRIIRAEARKIQSFIRSIKRILDEVPYLENQARICREN